MTVGLTQKVGIFPELATDRPLLCDFLLKGALEGDLEGTVWVNPSAKWER